METKIERRLMPIGEFRVEEDQGKKKIRGYAAVFNQETDLGYYREVVRKGAFSRALMANPETNPRADVCALIEHDPLQIVGRWSAGNLTLREDDHGLYIEIAPPDTQRARDLITDIDVRNIKAMSFGFIPRSVAWTAGENGESELREILDADLFDVSAVTYAAYPQTEIHVRGLEVRSLKEILEERKAEEVSKDEDFQVDAQQRELQIKLAEASSN